MLRLVIILGAAVLAVGGSTLFIEAAILPANSAMSSDLIVYMQAIHQAILGIGLMLLAIFGVLIVILLPERLRVETSY